MRIILVPARGETTSTLLTRPLCHDRRFHPCIFTDTLFSLFFLPADSSPLSPIKGINSRVVLARWLPFSREHADRGSRVCDLRFPLSSPNFEKFRGKRVVCGGNAVLLVRRWKFVRESLHDSLSREWDRWPWYYREERFLGDVASGNFHWPIAFIAPDIDSLLERITATGRFYFGEFLSRSKRNMSAFLVFSILWCWCFVDIVEFLLSFEAWTSRRREGSYILLLYSSHYTAIIFLMKHLGINPFLFHFCLYYTRV